MTQPEKTTTQQVLDAISVLCEESKLATRDSIQQLTNLPYTIIDDRIKVLIDDGLIIRVQRGNFILAKQFPPPRIISKTILSNGTVVLDIGDTVLHLTPLETRYLGQLLMGDAFLYTLIGLSSQFEQIGGNLNHRLRQLEKQKKDTPQQPSNDKQINLL